MYRRRGSRDPVAPALPRLRALFIPLIAGAVAGCDPAGAPGAIQQDTLRNGEVAVSTESALVGGLTDMAVGGDGTLYLLDYQSYRVLGVQPPTGDTVVIGREGEGPGEFERPVAMAVSGDTVWVHDTGTGRLQAFATSGAYLDGWTVESAGLGGGSSVGPGGRLAAATGGIDSSMVALFDAEGRRTAAFGTPVVPPVSGWDFTAMKNEIAAGGVPDAFRNLGLPAWGPAGSVWLVLLGEGRVRRYDAGGEVLWERELDDPLLPGIRSAFFDRNAAEPNPSAIFPLRYVRDARASADGLWLVLDTPDDVDSSVVLLIDPADGAVRRRFVVAGVADVGQVAVGPEGRHVYLSRRDDASVMRFPLPDMEE